MKLNPVSALRLNIWRAISFHPFSFHLFFILQPLQCLPRLHHQNLVGFIPVLALSQSALLPFSLYSFFQSFLRTSNLSMDCPWEDPSGSGGSWELLPNLNHPYNSMHKDKWLVFGITSTNAFCSPSICASIFERVQHICGSLLLSPKDHI